MYCAVGVLLFLTASATGQECTWDWKQPVSQNYTRTNGAPGELIVEVSDNWVNSMWVRWTLGGETIALYEYNATGNSFNMVTNKRGVFNASRVGSVSVYSLKITNFTSADHGKAVDVTNEDCSLSSKTSPTRTIEVKDCDTGFYNPNASRDFTPALCGFGCKVNFTCSVTGCGGFEGVCQADASWHPLQAQCSRTCESFASSNMGFMDGGSVTCGERKKVVCLLGPDICGSTFGTCNRPDNIVTLENPGFKCDQQCSVSDYSNIAELPDMNPVCGGRVEFACKSDGFCKPTNFTVRCGMNGTWIDTDEPKCVKSSCNETSIASVCGNNCDAGNVTSLLCGERLNYTCESGAQPAATCMDENTFDLAGYDALCDSSESSIIGSARTWLKLIMAVSGAFWISLDTL